VGDFVPITDGAWHPVDAFLAIAKYSMRFKLYKMNLESKLRHHLHRTVESESSQSFQALWSP